MSVEESFDIIEAEAEIDDALVVDGVWGVETTKALQTALDLDQSGSIKNNQTAYEERLEGPGKVGVGLHQPRLHLIKLLLNYNWR